MFYTKSQSSPVSQSGDSLDNVLFIDFLSLPDFHPLPLIGVSWFHLPIHLLVLTSLSQTLFLGEP